jgi:hypothetical protein
MGGLSEGGTDEMSRQTHFWLRLTAIAVIAALAWLPRGSQASSAKAHVESQAVHASVATR